MKRKIEIEVTLVDQSIVSVADLLEKIKDAYLDQGEDPLECNSCGWLSTEAEELETYEEINHCIDCGKYLCGLCIEKTTGRCKNDNEIFLCRKCNRRKK